MNRTPALARAMTSVAFVAFALAAPVSVFPAAAQGTDEAFDPTGPWTWESLRSAPDVDSAKVDWLEGNMELEDAGALFQLVQQLSRPEAAQLLGSRFYGDPSFHFARDRSPLLDSTAATLSTRPPPGTAGFVHVAFLAERVRREVWSRSRAAAFVPGALDLERVEPSDRLHVTLDFDPARTLLDVLSGTRSASEPGLLDHPAFEALYSHRSQSFYQFAIGPEALRENLEAAASDRAVDQLYRYAFPRGLMHFAMVRNHLASYQALVDTLVHRSPDIEAHLSGTVGPYVPQTLQVHRTVSFLFADGADGWAADGIAGIDLEFFRDDYDRLLTLLAHETYHAVQASARRPAGVGSATEADGLFLRTLDVLLSEGTATYVAPPRVVTEDGYTELVWAGSRLVSDIHAALYGEGGPDMERARQLYATGIRGSGPLYWLGAEMARRIDGAGGRAALTQTLFSDGLDFARTYLSFEETTDSTLIAPPVGHAIEEHSRRRGQSAASPAVETSAAACRSRRGTHRCHPVEWDDEFDEGHWHGDQLALDVRAGPLAPWCLAPNAWRPGWKRLAAVASTEPGAAPRRAAPPGA